MRGCPGVSDTSLVWLGRHCSKLRALDAGRCDVSDAGLAALSQGCGANLRRLSLAGCEAVTSTGE